MLLQIDVELKAAAEVMADVARRRRVQVMMQIIPVSGMGTLIDDPPGTHQRRKTTKIGQPLFGGDHLDRMLAMIDMRTHRYNS